MKSNSIIIDFIGDDYIEYSDFWKNTYQNLSIDSQILYDSLHSNVIYNIFDEIKLYIRENIDNLDLSIYDYYLLHYFNIHLFLSCIFLQKILQSNSLLSFFAF